MEIRKIRAKLGLTPAELATLIGVSGPGVIADLEAGIIAPSGPTKTILIALSSFPAKKSRELAVMLLSKSGIKIK